MNKETMEFDALFFANDSYFQQWGVECVGETFCPPVTVMRVVEVNTVGLGLGGGGWCCSVGAVLWSLEN